MRTRTMRAGTDALILTLALGSLAAPLAVEAQQPAMLPRIGYLTPSPISAVSHFWEAFRQGLRELGYVEGRNMAIERRSAEGEWERLPDLAAELIRLKVDVIVTATPPGVQAAQRATSTIPIVFLQVGDPVAWTRVRSGGRLQAK